MSNVRTKHQRWEEAVPDTIVPMVTWARNIRYPTVCICYYREGREVLQLVEDSRMDL